MENWAGARIAAFLAWCAGGFACPSVLEAAREHRVPSATKIVDGAELGIEPGDTIRLDAGPRGPLVVRRVHGAPQRPVTIANGGGVVEIDGTGGPDGIRIEESSHFELRGDGVEGVAYGIRVVRATDQGVHVTSRSTDFELCGLQISHAGYAGIMCKTDPRCDPAYNRGRFVQRNTRVRDNLVRDVGGEGLYIGSSFYTGYRSASCGELFPHDLVGVRVQRNVTERTGREGIQVGCAREDCDISYNTIRDPGRRGLVGQGSGLQLSPGTTGNVVGNRVVGAAQNGIVLLGLGDSLVCNNVVADSGGHAIFCDNRNHPTQPSLGTRAGSSIRVLNNTLIAFGGFAFRTFNESSVQRFANNLVVSTQGEAGALDAPGIPVSRSDNLVRAIAAEMGFVDAAAHDFRLRETSIARGAGLNLASEGFSTDALEKPRPDRGAWSVGAYEP